jgi:hypothetical protein
MAPKRLITAATVLAFGLNLASCGGFVADHWPHWAGGLPADVPPRPGAPGYADFVAHGQPQPNAAPNAAADGKQEPATTAATAQSALPQSAAAPAPPALPVRAATPNDETGDDSSAVRGGLY